MVIPVRPGSNTGGQVDFFAEKELGEPVPFVSDTMTCLSWCSMASLSYVMPQDKEEKNSIQPVGAIPVSAKVLTVS